MSLAELLYLRVTASCHAMREMFGVLFAKLALLPTKFNVVAPVCVDPSSCKMMGAWVEEMVAPVIEIPVPAVNEFCLAASRLFRVAVSVYAANAFVRAVFVA